MDRIEQPTFGDRLEAFVWECKEAWRNEYARGVPLADLMSWHLRTVQLQVEMFRNGRANVTVTIVSTKAWQSEVYFEKLAHISGRWDPDNGGYYQPEL